MAMVTMLLVKRTNLLIDGVVPVNLATWTRDDGTVDGIEKSTWIYPLEVGNTLTCSVTVLPHIAVYVAPEPELHKNLSLLHN